MPVHQGKPYTAGLTATTLAPQSVSHNYLTLSGLTQGGLKGTVPSMERMTTPRFRVGPVANNSQGHFVARQGGASYLSEDDVRASLGDVTTQDVQATAQAGFQAIQRAWQNTDCRWLAAAVAALFILRKGL